MELVLKLYEIQHNMLMIASTLFCLILAKNNLQRILYYFAGLVYQNLHSERLWRANGKRVKRRSSNAICREEYQ